jgi:Flp pilus assembly protein TadD
MISTATFFSGPRFRIREFFSSLTSIGILRNAIAPLALILLFALSAPAADLQLKIPKRTKPTPVQALNQEGVKALAKNDIAHAKRAFYKAYLIDPDDPFTLNNLGYVAELDGDIDRAQKFYDLAAANGSDASIALSSNPDLQGKQVSQVAGNAVSAPMQVNRLNVAAMGLMVKDRAPEAELALRKALALDPKNPFTLNNLGFALEKEGELEQAVRFYQQAAAIGSNEKVVVAFNRSWRGRPISEVASLNANAARRELSSEGTSEARVARLNLRGVSALNRNQTAQARQYFQQAYRIDPDNAFSLNNMGYIAETEGDRETADFYYAKARQAYHSNSRVTLASRKEVQGRRLASVADQNDQAVQNAQERQIATLRASGAPPLPLRTRNNAIVQEPATPPIPEPDTPIRILAENNAPPERPAAMAAPAYARNQPASRNPQSAQIQPSQGYTPQPAPPVPVVTRHPEEEWPLLPVIPDDDLTP